MSMRLNYVDSRSAGQGQADDYSPKSGADNNSQPGLGQTVSGKRAGLDTDVR